MTHSPPPPPPLPRAVPRRGHAHAHAPGPAPGPAPAPERHGSSASIGVHERGASGRSRSGAAGARSARLTAALARSRAWARPAGTGARLAAYTIDVVACVLVAVAAGLLTRSAVIGVLVLLEAAVILLILEARTGATLGNLLLRLRTARDDAPFSPGVARGAVRGLVQGLGSAVALIGGWAVVATSAADPSRMGRSWADRAGRTLVVRVPTAAERESWDRDARAWAQGAPSPASPGPTGAVLGASIPAGPAAPLPPGVVAVDAPIAAAPRPREVGEFLLLSFDTGQRERLRIPTTAHLGRQPAPSAEGEQLVAVYDPDSSVSKTHLRLEYRGGSVWVTDLGSTNGSVLVDDTGESTSLERGARIRLDDGASVRMGERGFTVAVVTGEIERDGDVG
ncbi:FHA domain-containing protein [Leucobacter triazinivorans]|uniref:FHA domain-containing protein n=1 Tax=Leucobacter triazinivorans TaxID=1784719 RepID=A0A4P6KH19_9MICO|nr:FHA domain-containing protein [Leucobacter triazinivorans]QBE49381.1 FHA domain-containing protein [Leucobacter triazinivorans]